MGRLIGGITAVCLGLPVLVSPAVPEALTAALTPRP
jgi:hypothetical protein